MNVPTLANLTDAGKEELALAILLWKDFKADGKFDVDITMQALKFAAMLDVQQQFEKLMVTLPPLKITPR